ncbi:hypothetical protein ACS0TY_012936 [Phlomoides rotata]
MNEFAGYGMECSNYMKGVGIKLASHGYAVFGIDYEGHGRSSGARCYIKRFDNIVNDSSEYFKSICAKGDYAEKRRFLYGESMGGAVALLTHKKDPSFWDGAVLVAPMCKISEKVKPHPVIISLLTRVEDVIPKWKIVPTKDVIDSAFKDPHKREEIRSNKLIYQEKPRLKTALELLRTSMNLEDSLNEVRLISKILSFNWTLKFCILSARILAVFKTLVDIIPLLKPHSFNNGITFVAKLHKPILFKGDVAVLRVAR